MAETMPELMEKSYPSGLPIATTGPRWARDRELRLIPKPPLAGPVDERER